MNPSFDFDNDDATIGVIYTRRETMLLAAKAGFGFLAAGSAAAALAKPLNQVKPSVHLVASPILTEGPFFVDEKLNRSDLVSETTRASVIQGAPLQLAFAVHQLKNGVLQPLSGAHVDVWHADAAGVYSDENNPMNHEDTSNQRWLRGYQVTNAKGLVQFATIFPGWYNGRTTHIHFKIRSYSSAGRVTAEFTSQLFFDPKLKQAIHSKAPYRNQSERETRNEEDGIFSERQVDGTLAGTHLMPTVQANPRGHGYVAHFSVALTEGNFNLNHHEGPGGPPSGGGWGPPPPPPDDRN